MLSDLHELGEANKSDGDFSDKRFEIDFLSNRSGSIDMNQRQQENIDAMIEDLAVMIVVMRYALEHWTEKYRTRKYPTVELVIYQILEHFVKPVLDIPLLMRTVFGSSTLHSFTVTDCSTFSPSETVIEKFCRICHSFGSSGDPLISPCRCTGSLKYVHISCLLHWLTICAHKLKRPAICELCLYKYRRRNMIDWHNLHLPSISRHDLRYLIAFIIAATMMFLSAAASFICFCIERNLVRNDTMDDSFEMIGKESGEWETLLTSSTFLSAFLFFVALFVALYAHVKTNTSLASYIYRFWVNNQNWMIEEYRPSRDQRYCHKMEQLRRRLNGNTFGVIC
uniref:RING-CH-type domain-containing protein n=1 Tax=Setaria digitata TaxID=48799 RepID=A0A915PKM0_9BILA